LRIRNAPAGLELRQVITKRYAEQRTGEEKDRVEPLGVTAEPIGFAGSNAQGIIDIASGITSAVDPAGEAEIGVEKEDHVGMGELGASFADLETDRVEERVDVWLGGGTDGPTQRDGFAVAILGKGGGMIGGVEGEEEDAELARIGGRSGESVLESIDVLDAGAATAGVDRKEDHWVTGELGEIAGRAGLIDPIDRGDGAAALWFDLNDGAVRFEHEQEHEHEHERGGSFHGLDVIGTGLSGV
jgi:hypothetical protein